MAYSADIDIQEAVVVDVDDGDACGPAIVFGNPGFSGNIFEMQVAFIQVEPVGPLVGCEEQVDLPVVVEVAGAYPAAVVVIHVIEYVELASWVQAIAEVKAGPGIVEHLESRVLHSFRMPAGREEGKDAEQANGYGKVSG